MYELISAINVMTSIIKIEIEPPTIAVVMIDKTPEITNEIPALRLATYQFLSLFFVHAVLTPAKLFRFVSGRKFPMIIKVILHA